MSCAPHPGLTELTAFAQRVRTGAVAPLLGPHTYDAEQAALARPAAVLVLFAPTAAGGQGLDLFLAQRSPHLRHHPGQISLPGGALEPGETPVEAAVRETHEEIGLEPALVQVLAQLDPVMVPVSGFVVHPVLGWTDHPDAATETSQQEVLQTLRVPMAQLLDPVMRGKVQWRTFVSNGFERPGGWIWGFTGNLLSHLFDELGWTRPWGGRVHQMTTAAARGDQLR